MGEGLQYWNESGGRRVLGGWRGCVSVTAINGLIMYLAVLASCEKGEGGRERGERKRG